jgi:hypothetical protein
MRGDVDVSRLPHQPAGACWDYVSILPGGFGVAVGHQAGTDGRGATVVFVTRDGGQQWQENGLRVESPEWHRTRPASWPVERFASLVLTEPEGVVLAWEDPWLMDHSQSHVLWSHDRCESWRYHCLGESNPYLALDHGGRLLALNDGYFLQSPDGARTWARRDFVVAWPAGHRHQRVALLRQAIFPQPGTGYALVVHWRQASESELPPDVGLVATNDDGGHWRHLHTFEGPHTGDVNERHVLTLRVGGWDQPV